MELDETTCPECAEVIKAAAKVCKHCGYRMPVDSVQATLQANPSERASTGHPTAMAPASSDDWWERMFAEPRLAKGGCLGLLGLIIIGVSLMLFIAGDDESLKRHNRPNAVAVKEPAQSDESKAIDVMVDAKENVKARLRDTDSAQFRDLTVFKNDGKLWALCGQVNSKNGFGGFTGFKGFVAFAHTEAPTVIDGEPSGMGAGIDRDLYREARKTFCIRPVKRF